MPCSSGKIQTINSIILPSVLGFISPYYTITLPTRVPQLSLSQHSDCLPCQVRSGLVSCQSYGCFLFVATARTRTTAGCKCSVVSRESSLMTILWPERGTVDTPALQPQYLPHTAGPCNLSTSNTTTASQEPVLEGRAHKVLTCCSFVIRVGWPPLFSVQLTPDII